MSQVLAASTLSTSASKWLGLARWTDTVSTDNPAARTPRTSRITKVCERAGYWLVT